MRVRSISSPLLLSSILALTGCAFQQNASPTATAGVAFQGRVHGGQQPVTGAHVYLMQATTAGYGNAATDILTTGVGSDTVGTYVTTDTNGDFAISGDYSCTPNDQVYVLATGGNPGLPGSVDNTSLAMMAVLGNCPASGNFASAVPYIQLNEVTTVAAAYALGAFMSSPTQVSSSSTNAAVGLANAFATAGNLASITSGQALATTPNGNGIAPQTTINTLANILATCVNSNGTVAGPTNPTPCYSLFNAAPNGSTIPADTITALLNIVHNSSNNVEGIYGLQSATAPFGPNLATAPTNFGLSLTFTIDSSVNYPDHFDIDNAGNLYKTDTNISTRKMSPLGVIEATYSTSGVENSTTNAYIDPNTQNLWVLCGDTQNIAVYNSTGTSLTPHGISFGTYVLQLSFDNAGHAFGIDNASTLVKLSSTSPFAAASGSPFTLIGAPSANYGDAGIAITSGGLLWIAQGDTISSTTISAPATSVAVTNNDVSSSLYLGESWAIDSFQDAYQILNTESASQLAVWDSAGNVYPNSPFALPKQFSQVAIDGGNNLWLSADGGPLRASIAAEAASAQFSNPAPYQAYCSPDQSGNVWCETATGFVEYPGVASPTSNPISMTNHGTLP